MHTHAYITIREIREHKIITSLTTSLPSSEKSSYFIQNICGLWGLDIGRLKIFKKILKNFIFLLILTLGPKKFFFVQSYFFYIEKN